MLNAIISSHQPSAITGTYDKHPHSHTRVSRFQGTQDYLGAVERGRGRVRVLFR